MIINSLNRQTSGKRKNEVLGQNATSLKLCLSFYGYTARLRVFVETVQGKKTPCIFGASLGMLLISHNCYLT